MSRGQERFFIVEEIVVKKEGRGRSGEGSEGAFSMWYLILVFELGFCSVKTASSSSSW